MENIRILHLSDLHMHNEKLHDIRIVLDALLIDLDNLRKEKDLNVDFVCFTGDLIQRGDRAYGQPGQYELALDYFVQPLLDQLDLLGENFFIVPGNHEVDQSKIDLISEDGLRSRLKNRDEINRFIDSLNSIHIQRIIHFDYFAKCFQQNAVWTNQIASAHIRQKGDFLIGFACLNSAWRAMGTGKDEMGRLILGERQVDLAYQYLENCDIKIALMHHPTYWLVEHDKIAVERCLANFDIVLNGHLHDLAEEQLIVPGHNTVRLTCGSLFDGRSEYNGYSIIDINPFTRTATTYFRQYSDKRRAFIPAESIIDGGHYTYQLDSTYNPLAIGYHLINDLKAGIISYADSALVSTVIDELAPQELNSIFVPPNLSESSEYRKEEDTDKTDITLESILKRYDNILFIGRKEIGKTTLLHYIAIFYAQNFIKEHKIPFLIDLRYLTPGKDPIERAIMNYIWDKTDYRKITKEDIVKLLETGSCIILFDNLEANNEKLLQIVQAFTHKYDKNRYIFVLNENVYETISLENSLDLGCNYTRIYIHTMSRNHIRKLIMNWFGGRQIDIELLLDRIMYFLTYIGMPRTPLIVSLLLAIINKQHDYTPINEAALMERFMEMALEKLSPVEMKSSTYDFWNKEHYLSHLAWCMVENDKYYFTKAEYAQITENYFKSKGLSLSKSKFDTLFFEKKILVQDGEHVYFRFKSILQYYIARKLFLDPQALAWVLQKENYIKFADEICFLTGLDRTRIDILQYIENELTPEIEKYLPMLQHLSDYGLDHIEFNSDIDQNLHELKMTDQEKDRLFDYPDLNTDFETQKIERQDYTKYPEKYIFLKLLNLYGRVIRNSEALDISIKTDALNTYVTGCCILLADIKLAIEELITKENLDEIMLSRNIEHKIDQNYVEIMQNIMKITAPLVIQNLAAETVGTGKLDSVLLDLVHHEENEFLRFMYVFLYSDLKMQDFLNVIQEFLSSTKSKDLIQLSVFKLLYYYQTGHTRQKDDDRVVALIADTILRLNKYSKFSKGRLMNAIRRPDVEAKKLLAKI